MGRLAGKNVLITGASQGLGRQLAIDFAREGAAVISVVARRTNALKEVRERVSEIAPETRVLVIDADLSRADEIERVVGATLLHITGDYPLKVVDGLLSGFHEPEASHLDLLTAFLPAQKIKEAYEEAVRQKYLWHEFGDLNLIL